MICIKLSGFKYHYIMVGWLVGFYGISTFVSYFMPDSFLYK